VVGSTSAAPLHDQRLNRDPVAGRDLDHARAHGDELAAEFMAKNLRAAGAGTGMRAGRDKDRTIGIFVQVGAANAGMAVADQDLAGAGPAREYPRGAGRARREIAGPSGALPYSSSNVASDLAA
jgi:hypothetical protein